MEGATNHWSRRKLKLSFFLSIYLEYTFNFTFCFHFLPSVSCFRMHQVLLQTLRRKLWAPHPWKWLLTGVFSPRGHGSCAVEPVGCRDQQYGPGSAAAGREGVGGREGDTSGPGQLHYERWPGEGLVPLQPHCSRWETDKMTIWIFFLTLASCQV